MFNSLQPRSAPTTMKPNTPNLELISALADGQLTGAEFGRALSVCEEDAEALGRWEAYHLIGDVLRAPGPTAPARDAGFVTRLNARLAQEPGPAAPPLVTLGAESLLPAGVVHAGQRGEAANDSSLRWKLLAGFARFHLAQGARSARQDAAQQVLVVSEQGTMVRDARMQELLAAHKQFGGTSALQAPSGFLRHATFETSQGERR